MGAARNERRLDRKAKKKRTSKIQKQIDANIVKNECGECQACCTLLGVPEIDKAPGTKCANLCDKGCSTYDIRPKSCRDFVCLWTMCMLPLGDRPDKSGVVVDLSHPDSEYGRQILVAREARDGALENIMGILQQLASEGHVILLIKQGEPRRLIGPEHLVKEAWEFIRKKLPTIR